METLLIQLSNAANAAFLIVVIVAGLFRMTDGAAKPIKETIFLFCICMGAFMQLFPFPDPNGVGWDLVVFRLGQAGWSLLALQYHFNFLKYPWRS